jgi:hypothetical protein
MEKFFCHQMNKFYVAVFQRIVLRVLFQRSLYRGIPEKMLTTANSVLDKTTWTSAQCSIKLGGGRFKVCWNTECNSNVARGQQEGSQYTGEVALRRVIIVY